MLKPSTASLGFVKVGEILGNSAAWSEANHLCGKAPKGDLGQVCNLCGQCLRESPWPG